MGGDVIEMNIHVKKGCRAVLTGQESTKVCDIFFPPETDILVKVSTSRPFALVTVKEW